LEQSLYPAIFEIMGTKHIGVMTLTFLGHVTSSVTWPLDSMVELRTSMNSPHCSGFSYINIVQKYAVFDRLKCEKQLRHFDAVAVEERCKWTALFSYDRLPF